MSTEEKLDPTADLKKVNKLLTHAMMVDSLIVAYVQFVLMLIELKEVIHVQIALNANDLKQSLCSKTTTVLSE